MLVLNDPPASRLALADGNGVKGSAGYFAAAAAAGLVASAHPDTMDERNLASAVTIAAADAASHTVGSREVGLCGATSSTTSFIFVYCVELSVLCDIERISSTNQLYAADALLRSATCR